MPRSPEHKQRLAVSWPGQHSCKGTTRRMRGTHDHHFFKNCAPQQRFGTRSGEGIGNTVEDPLSVRGKSVAIRNSDFTPVTKRCLEVILR